MVPALGCRAAIIHCRLSTLIGSIIAMILPAWLRNADPLLPRLKHQSTGALKISLAIHPNLEDAATTKANPLNSRTEWNFRIRT